ncbi:MAG: ATP phosphoribosyltransferase [Fastidiosipilaceae bacterium]|jgi:ATP phosphoribosyltransferase
MKPNMLTIALAKGRLGDQAIELLEKAGYDCGVVKKKTRKLILEDERAGLRFIMSKPVDVPTYVAYGAADVGVVGKDTLLEAHENLYEVLDLNYGRCRLAVCGPKNEVGCWSTIPDKRVATKYPMTTREYFAQKRHESVEIIKLNGSIELAPLIGLADVIVDIVESGATLRENDMEVFETIAPISARLVVNRVSMKMKNEQINPLIQKVRKVVEELKTDSNEQ